MNMTVEESQHGYAQGRTAESVTQGSNGVEHDDCNPFLCNVLALTVQSSEVIFDKSEAAIAWQVSKLSALEEPGSPERPPNN